MQDLRQTVRQMAQRPGVAATIVLTLALGIGANALVFTAVRAVLLKPLPFPGAAQLVNVWETRPGETTRGVAPANFLDWRSASSFDGLAAYNSRRRSLGLDDPQRIEVATVSANFFAVLGVQPIAGRTFDPARGVDGMSEIVMREDLWRLRFAGDPSMVGHTIRLDEETLVVVGIVPQAMGFPEEVVAWRRGPFDVPELGGGAPADVRSIRDAWYFRVVGRMKPGVTASRAQAEMDAIARRLREAHPTTNRDAGVSIVDLQTQMTRESAPILWVLLGVVGCVLAIACGNVATLLLAAAVGRSRELAIRAALGASPRRLVRQLLVESLVLALAGAAAGLALAWAGRPALAGLLPAGTPRTATIGIDGVVVLFTLAVALITAAVFGTAPALIASRAGSFTSLRDGGRIGRSRFGSRMASALVGAQLALALALVTGSGLMLRTLWTLSQRDLGIDVERVLAIDVLLPDARSRGRAAAALDIHRMAERLALLPGVSAAAAVQTLPLAGRGPSAGIRVEGRTFPPNEAPDVVWKTVTPEYFLAVGAQLRRGRAFTSADRDGSPPVAVINERLARLLWPDRDPLGMKIGTGLDGNGAPATIVGVVGDTPQEGIGAEVLPEMYRPLAQPARFGVESMSLVVRTDGDPRSLAAAAREAIREIHPRAPVPAIRPMTVMAHAGISRERTATRALAIFGGLALVLAAIGLYGVMTRLVGDRTRELGVRLALGAAPRNVCWLVLRRTATLAAAGLAAGGVGSVLLSRQLGSLLHGVSPADPLVLSAAAVVLFGTALLASYLPARRASRIDPLIVMKTE
jgi:predicted permease